MRDPHSRLTVLNLALLVLHRDDNARGEVGDPHGGVSGVNRLTAGARGPENVNLEIVCTDIQLFGFIDLGKNEHPCG